MDIANEVLDFKVEAADIDKKASKYFSRIRNAQGLLKLAQRKSIMTMAAPGFYMYPVVMSGGIETAKQTEIAKAFQYTFASSVATAYSLNGNMDRSSTPQVSDFVKTFHQNDPKLINANLNGIKSALGIQESTINVDDLKFIQYAVKDAVVLENALTLKDSFLIDLIAWDDVENGLVMESLNDVYRPYQRTEKILRDRLDDMHEARAMEGIGDSFDSFATQVNLAASGRPNTKNATQTSFSSYETNDTYRPLKGLNGNLIKDKDGNVQYEKTTSKKKSSRPFDRSVFNKVDRVQNMTSLEPTMVNVQVVAHGGKDANGSPAPSVHNITLCIKAMPRIISPSLMIASMVEACQNSHAIFKFLKFTKGEVSTLDKVLGISASKKKALQKNAKNEVKFLEQAAKRKGKGLIGRFVKNEVLPTMTVIITSYEAEKIKEVCGVDLNRYEMAAKLMAKYYLLGFCIYDTEQDTLKVLFDADTDWGTTSFQSMTNATSNAKDMLSQNDVLRIFGRK